MGTAENIRGQVVARLELLASLEQQDLYRRNVPIADVPAEMFCVWFDDLDLPGSAPTAFTGPTLDEVRRFSALLEAAATQLSGLGLDELHRHPMWLRIVSEARALLLRLRAEAVPMGGAG